ncbi:MAG: aldehyde dehydrogenase family protein [Planctomycetota bacterium]|jgi:aldehyde dehydrogenase (NAD+)|nr:aldehyde dehydrogenase family protein [Planctomycetota bacterium]HBO52568.1 aldehyde dehydrogenase family protein [Planctomycetota bacterium]
MTTREIPPELDLQPVEAGVCSNGSWSGQGEELVSINPANSEELARVTGATPEETLNTIQGAYNSFEDWKKLPAPRRGEYIRLIGEELRRFKEPLGKLVSLESGKVLSEGEGEVQEMIDIADFAVGLSRTIGGATLPSERPDHRMFEQWHPLGPVGVITAFNFPVAVWSWNALVAAICGDTIVWKPSEKTPLTAIAVQKICNRVLEPEGLAGVFNLCCGGIETGELIAADERLPLISATGSCRMGRKVAVAVAGRMGRSLLELGGNNAIIILDDADVDLGLRAVLFGSLGTAGQRCTTTRRVLAQQGILPTLAKRLTEAFESVIVGDPLDPKTLVGPLIDEDAVNTFEKAVAAARDSGGEVLTGGQVIEGPGFFVQPTLIKADSGMEIVREETFAPILYLLETDGLDEAISAQNNVRQGLSSAIFTDSVRNAERFLSVAGSDCGIANVNIGTSGAEIGGAFGGEKETGGGREAGSDSWKAYMRRQTCTINYGTELPLAQGVRFDLD